MLLPLLADTYRNRRSWQDVGMRVLARRRASASAMRAHSCRRTRPSSAGPRASICFRRRSSSSRSTAGLSHRPSGHCAVRQDRPLFSHVLPRDRSLHWSLAVIHDPHNCIDDPAAASARTSDVRACHETHPANLCELAPQALGHTHTRMCPSKRSRQLIDGCAISAALVASPRNILGSFTRRMLPLACSSRGLH